MLKHIINITNPPHAILIKEEKLCDLKELVKQYKTQIKLNDPNCFIELNGYEETIKKDNIHNIIERFNLSSFNDSSKLYVIYGIENASPQAINSLLKFLEEPPNMTYCILTTRSINYVLPTIRSRCQIFSLASNFDRLNELIQKYNLTAQQTDVVKLVYYDLEILNNDLSSGIFLELFDKSKTLVKNSNNPKIIKEVSEQFKKMSYEEILKLLQFINYFVKPNVDLLKLIDSIKFTPSRSMIFNQLWMVLENK